ncbi:MAG TPA: phosphoglycerate kinase [Acidimicrobiales bacterium]|nr:phosphoglycerate kinase [Acidimicrobiales bacterium]
MADQARPQEGPAVGLPLLEDLPDVEGRRVLVRVDFNVPLGHGADGEVVVDDDFRIRAALPTLSWLTDRGASVTACTHLGRPKGRVDPRFEVAPVRARLAELAPGVALLENLRFDPGEEANDPAFVDRLVAGFDAYVNDAFGASHRSHASIVGPPARLPSAAGRLLEREVGTLGGLLVGPDRPFVAVVGGSKVGEKLGVLRALLARVDSLIVGGGMAFTFLAAQGHTVGASLLDAGRIDSCGGLLQEAGGRIVLPTDFVALAPGGSVGAGASGSGEVRMVGVDIPRRWRGLDIGPESAGVFADLVAPAGTVFWNGPMGVFEDDRFSAGTRTVARAVADAKGFSIVGGGDSAAALDHLGLAGRVGFVSTGGGASLELLEHSDLPGLEALRHASNAPGATA